MQCVLGLCLVFILPLVLTNSLPGDAPHAEYPHNVAQRIIGGEEAKPHSFPYQVALFMTVPGQTEKMFCGGSLLSNIYVLTAAHCVHGVPEAEVVLGAHNVHEKEDAQLRIISKVLIVHKGWNPFTLADDIALVRLPRPISFSAEIKPIVLPKQSDQDKSFSFKTATVSGWGKTSDDAEQISSLLRYAESKVTLPLVCKAMFLGKVGDDQICLDGYKGKSTCSGDSGGPMVIYENGKPVQQGVVSFGIGFGCEKGWPQVFTKVSRYLKWIFEHTGIPIRQ